MRRENERKKFNIICIDVRFSSVSLNIVVKRLSVAIEAGAIK